MASSKTIIGEDGNINVSLTVAASETSPVASISAGFGTFTVQTTGSFGTAGAVQLQGANVNDAAQFTQLKDDQGVSVSMTDATVVNLSAVPAYIRAVADANIVGVTVVVHGIGQRV